MELESEEYVLFDSAVWGTQIEEGESLTLKVEPGSYQISTLEYQPDEQTYFRLHKLQKV